MDFFHAAVNVNAMRMEQNIISFHYLTYDGVELDRST